MPKFSWNQYDNLALFFLLQNKEFFKGYENLKEIKCVHRSYRSAIKVTVTPDDFNHLIKICGAWNATDCCILRSLVERFWVTINTFYFPLVKMMMTPEHLHIEWVALWVESIDVLSRLQIREAEAYWVVKVFSSEMTPQI